MSWVVEVRHRSMPHLVHYWYGPEHGFGTTSGAVDDFAVASFRFKKDAEAALRSVFGRPAVWRSRGYSVVRDPIARG